MREKRRIAIIEATNRPEEKKKRSERAKKLWDDPEYREKMESNREKCNSPEAILKKNMTTGTYEYRNIVINAYNSEEWKNYKGSKTTKRFQGPWILIWKQEHPTRREAMKAEKNIKKRGIKRFLQDNAQSIESRRRRGHIYNRISTGRAVACP